MNIVYQTCKQQHALDRTHFQALGGLLFYENGIGRSQMFNLGAKDETLNNVWTRWTAS